MSGHNKWGQIKHKKGAADIKRGQAFSKLSQAIAVAARDNPDPGTNLRLRGEIERARKINMPKENIERAIKRGVELS
jgi:transcriptional/translational regulatory protein YebC/TACO1